jgi:hypothetical protein
MVMVCCQCQKVVHKEIPVLFRSEDVVYEFHQDCFLDWFTGTWKPAKEAGSTDRIKYLVNPRWFATDPLRITEQVDN